MATRQRATAVYLIDRFALRAGNEKGEDEADTVGTCSLRFEHVTLTPPNKVTFDFLGKDSIRYVNEVTVDEQVFKNLKIFKKEPKAVGDLLFDRLSVRLLSSLSLSPSIVTDERQEFASRLKSSTSTSLLTWMDSLRKYSVPTTLLGRSFNNSRTLRRTLQSPTRFSLTTVRIDSSLCCVTIKGVFRKVIQLRWRRWLTRFVSLDSWPLVCGSEGTRDWSFYLFSLFRVLLDSRNEVSTNETS